MYMLVHYFQSLTHNNIADVNECDEENECDANAECQDTDGSYLCTCKSGFLGNGYNCTGANSKKKPTNSCLTLCISL